MDEPTLRETLDAGLAEGKFAALEYDGAEYIYLPEFLRAEMLVAGHLKALMSLPLQKMKDPDKAIGLLELTGGIRYAPLQRQAHSDRPHQQLHGAYRGAGHRQDHRHQRHHRAV